MKRFNKDIMIQRNIISPNEDPLKVIDITVDTIMNNEKQWNSSEEIEDITSKLRQSIHEQKIVLGTQILTNARLNKQPISACTVIPVNLREDYHKIRKDIEPYLKAGMGSGFCLDELEDPVQMLNYLNRLFIDTESACRRAVAGITTLRIDHPRILEYIRCKQNNEYSKWRFNISVGIPKNWGNSLDLGKMNKNIIFRELVDGMFMTGEPGIIFLDKYEEDNPTPQIKYESVAPCAEVALAAGEVCHFSYLNLYEFVNNNLFNFDALIEQTKLLTRFLDSCVDISIHTTFNNQSNIIKQKRKIGIGICGVASLLFKLKLSYGCSEARSLIENIVSVINFYSKSASIILSKERGPFPLFKQSRYSDYKWVMRKSKYITDYVTSEMWDTLWEEICRYGIRNSSTTAYPPTGNSSRIVYTSSGIEPMLSLLDINDELPTELIAELSQRLAKNELNDTIKELRKVGKCGEIQKIPKCIKSIFVTSTELNYKSHIEMAAAIQKHNDEAISKTINMPNSFMKEDIYELIAYAYKSNLKGITVFRESENI